MLRTLSLTASLLALTSVAMAHEFTTEDAARIDASSTAMPGEMSLADIRTATEKYRDVEVALADGYERDPGNICDTAEMMGKPAELGVMGIHFARADLLGITAPPDPKVDGNGTHTDFSQPSVLIYEPHADGSLQLVAVENLTFQKGWHAAGNAEPPRLHNVAYDTMADDPATPDIDEAHMFAPHYDRHIWLYRENPNGVFAQFNPNATCEHHVTDGAAHKMPGS